jgi:membrane-bound inhibitor of C-type lysozyme
MITDWRHWMRIPLLALTIAGLAGPASAASLEIPLPEGVEAQTIETSYACAERNIGVTYINAGDISLALLEFEDKTVVAANVLAASGARYAGGQYIWWSKGNEATLYDLMNGGEDAPGVACTENQ